MQWRQCLGLHSDMAKYPTYRWFKELRSGAILAFADDSIECFQVANRVDLWKEVAGRSGAPLEPVPHSGHHQSAATEFRSWLGNRVEAAVFPGGKSPGHKVTHVDGDEIHILIPDEHQLVPWLARYFSIETCTCRACASTRWTVEWNKGHAIRSFVGGFWRKFRYSKAGWWFRRRVERWDHWISRGMP